MLFGPCLQSYGGNLQRTPTQARGDNTDNDDADLMNRAIDTGLNMSAYEDNSDNQQPSSGGAVESPCKSKKFGMNEPRTPTPFKNALNEFRKRRGDK